MVGWPVVGSGSCGRGLALVVATATSAASAWGRRPGRRTGLDLDDADGFAAVGQAQPLTDADQLMAVPEDYQTVGHLYRGIEQGEGARGDWRDAHFGRFVALLEDYLATRATLVLTATQVQWLLIRMGRVPQPTPAQVHTFTMINWGLLLLDALLGVAVLRGRWRQALASERVPPAPRPTP